MYRKLNDELASRIARDREENKRSPFYRKESDAARRDPLHDLPSVWRTPFIRDTEKILHSAYYNRYADKTQVFSFYKNDDLTRRALHVQIVSRTARTLGTALGLNGDLIEAIAIGHDIGHTPFGHAGESFLSEILYARKGRYFSHNIHSVRVLDGIFRYNLTLDTLNGIAAHNGEIEAQHYAPKPMDFAAYDAMVEACYARKEANGEWIPSTLEGCLVRICDMIAYLGKDRQDALRIGLIESEDAFTDSGIGRFNAEIMNNIAVDIIENSYGKGYIAMSDACYEALRIAKRENYELIYFSPKVRDRMEHTIRPMMEKTYAALLRDYERRGSESLLCTHHISRVESDHSNRKSPCFYRETDVDTMLVDYIASMTDDYFFELYHHLFPKDSVSVRYVDYF